MIKNRYKTIYFGDSFINLDIKKINRKLFTIKNKGLQFNINDVNFWLKYFYFTNQSINHQIKKIKYKYKNIEIINKYNNNNKKIKREDFIIFF
jgi:hypothetical protein